MGQNTLPGVLFLLIFAATFSSCASTDPVEEPEPISTEKTQKVSEIRLQDLDLKSVRNEEKTSSKIITGRVLPRNKTQLFAEVQGRILPSDVNFKKGISFRKGATLVRIDSEEFRLGLEAQRSAFLNALTGLLPDMKSDYPDSYPTWLNYAEQYQIGSSLPTLPEAQSQEEKFLITGKGIYELYFSIKAQEERLKKYRISAPYSGTITAANIDLGGLVNPGQPVGSIISTNNYELEAGADLELAAKLKIGDRLTFNSNEIPGEWKGRIVRIGPDIDPQTQNVLVYFSLQGKDLRSGMYLEGKVQSSVLSEAYTIPASALKRDDSVLTLHNNIISRAKVKPVEYVQDSVIVQGLSDNTQIILNDFQTPVEGKRVDK